MGEWIPDWTTGHRTATLSPRLYRTWCSPGHPSRETHLGQLGLVPPYRRAQSALTQLGGTCRSSAGCRSSGRNPSLSPIQPSPLPSAGPCDGKTSKPQPSKSESRTNNLSAPRGGCVGLNSASRISDLRKLKSCVWAVKSVQTFNVQRLEVKCRRSRWRTISLIFIFG